MHGVLSSRHIPPDMSFKQLLKKGTLGDLRERVSADRDPSAAAFAASRRPRRRLRDPLRVLYITGDARESRIVSGAFSHPIRISISTSQWSCARRARPSDRNRSTRCARRRLERSRRGGVLADRPRARTGRWTADHRGGRAVARAVSPGRRRRVRAEGRVLPVASAGRDRGGRQESAGAARSPSPSREPSRPASPRFAWRMPATWRSSTPRSRVRLPPLECVSLADTLKDADLQPGAPPFDVVLIEHGDKSSDRRRRRAGAQSRGADRAAGRARRRTIGVRDVRRQHRRLRREDARLADAAAAAADRRPHALPADARARVAASQGSASPVARREAAGLHRPPLGGRSSCSRPTTAPCRCSVRATPISCCARRSM